MAPFTKSVKRVASRRKEERKLNRGLFMDMRGDKNRATAAAVGDV